VFQSMMTTCTGGGQLTTLSIGQTDFLSEIETDNQQILPPTRITYRRNERIDTVK
jgi:hypothetical protein